MGGVDSGAGNRTHHSEAPRSNPGSGSVASSRPVSHSDRLPHCLVWLDATSAPRLHAGPYHPPAILIVIGIVSIAILIGLAWLLRAYGHSGQIDSRQPANPGSSDSKRSSSVRPGSNSSDCSSFPTPARRSGFPWSPVPSGHSCICNRALLVRRPRLARQPPLRALLRSRGRLHGHRRRQFRRLVASDLIAKFVFQILAVVGFLLLARKIWQREAAITTLQMNRAHLSLTAWPAPECVPSGAPAPPTPPATRTPQTDANSAAPAHDP